MRLPKARAKPTLPPKAVAVDGMANTSTGASVDGQSTSAYTQPSSISACSQSPQQCIDELSLVFMEDERRQSCDADIKGLSSVSVNIVTHNTTYDITAIGNKKHNSLTLVDHPIITNVRCSTDDASDVCKDSKRSFTKQQDHLDILECPLVGGLTGDECPPCVSSSSVIRLTRNTPDVEPASGVIKPARTTSNVELASQETNITCDSKTSNKSPVKVFGFKRGRFAKARPNLDAAKPRIRY